MIYYAKEIKETIEENMDTIILYMFGSLICEDSNGLYSDEYRCEFHGYVNRVASSFDELLRNRQFTLTHEIISFILEYEMIGITCRPHGYVNAFEMNSLSKKLHELYVDKLVELNGERA